MHHGPLLSAPHHPSSTSSFMNQTSSETLVHRSPSHQPPGIAVVALPSHREVVTQCRHQIGIIQLTTTVLQQVKTLAPYQFALLIIDQSPGIRISCSFGVCKLLRLTCS
ncbi:hypothetical protein Q3G72_006384 [Acer saccharum]|nr:hypothetical protein Q3G72_006384 [Acer saccharum]